MLTCTAGSRKLLVLNSGVSTINLTQAEMLRQQATARLRTIEKPPNYRCLLFLHQCLKLDLSPDANGRSFITAVFDNW